jgi:Protein of unknown function (DUF732)
MFAVKRLVILFAPLMMVTGCGGQATSTQASQSQAAMLHSLLDSKTPRPTALPPGQVNGTSSPADDARFIEALKELPITLPPQHQVQVGKQVCASLEQNPDSTMADLVAGIRDNTAGAVEPPQAQFIATTAVSVYCPEDWVRPVV